MTQIALALSSHLATLAGQIDFDGWRDHARRLAMEGVDPVNVTWAVSLVDGAEPTLSPAIRNTDRTISGRGVANHRGGKASAASPIVPRAFIEAAQTAILHSDPGRFAFLYRLLCRLKCEPDLMHIASDSDIRRLEAMQKAIRRDIHKMRAFVRFREVDGHFFAWFEPAHFIVERNADFFVRRFTGMRWSILTPYRSAHWDGESLTFGPGAAKSEVPAGDAAEDLWRTYYRNIFNPARLKVKAMQAEMPKGYWRNLPEAALIPELVAGAGLAAKDMIARSPTLPAPHHARVRERHWPSIPPLDEGSSPADTLAGLAVQTNACRRCPLWRDATQAVFGAGRKNASVVFVGEQPGDQEDIAGQPFVGPAGKVFDAVLQEAGIDRLKTYVTNAVKHFKFEPRGKRRIHSKPNAGEVQACRWWLDHELGLIKPGLVVVLGATAARSLLEEDVPITRMRGQLVSRGDGLKVFFTVHPSYILRIPEGPLRQDERARFLRDMIDIKNLMVHLDQGRMTEQVG